MHTNDTLQRFLFEHAAIRGELIHLNQIYQTISQQRPYPPRVQKLLGEALMTCALLVGGIKFEGDISLQFQGDSRLPLILVQCNHLLHLRGFANFAENQSDADYEDAFIHGSMVINITPHHQTQTYQSIVPLTTCSMGENLMHYFAQSEQIPSKVWFAVTDQHAAGIILQLMPGQNSQQREQFWEYAVHIGQTITSEELLNLDNATFLHRLYHETELRLYPERDLQFRCRCTPEKMQQVLGVLGEQEVQELLREKGKIDISCEFCTMQYSFDPIDIAMLFRKQG